MISFDNIIGFEWDEGNARKNEKHGVSQTEAEQVFLNAPLLILEDIAHSGKEQIFHTLGVTDEGRKLHVTVTIRGSCLRVISARDMHKKERNIYETQS